MPVLRLRFDNVSDLGGANPLTFADGSTTTGTWSSSPALPTIASPYVVPMVVDPNTVDFEIVWLTAFTEGDSSGTFDRAMEGSSGVAHAAAKWFNGPTVIDFSFPTYEGSGNPEGSVVGEDGYWYVDTNNLGGGLYVFQGTPGDTTGWQQVGGATEVAVPGLFTGASEAGLMGGTEGGFVLFGDFYWFTGLGNGLLYTKSGTDGGQAMHLQLGSTGQYTWNWNADGSSILPGTLQFAGDAGPTIFTYDGDPTGHVTPAAEGDLCIDTGTPGIWQATGASDSDWALVGSEGGIGDISDIVLADSSTTLAADGSTTAVPPDMASPPSWMNTSGEIVTPGLYLYGASFAGTVAPTTPDLWVNVFPEGGFVGQGNVALDALQAGVEYVQFVVALGEGDLPYSASLGILMPTDATATVEIQGQVWQLATGVGGGGGGGGGTIPTYTGAGSPEGVQTATAEGQTYQDSNTGQLYYFGGSPDSNTGWTTGFTYDASIASTSPIPGAGISEDMTWIIAPGDGAAVMTDTYGASSTGSRAGFTLISNGSDETQQAYIILGASGSMQWQFQPAGDASFPGSLQLDRTVDGGGVTLYSLAGSPNGTLAPNASGDISFDPSTPAVWQNTDGTDSGWVELGSGGGGSFPDFTGSGSPEGSQSASPGQWYEDTSGGTGGGGTSGLYVYLGESDGDTGWVQVGGRGHTNAGLGATSDLLTLMAGPGLDRIYIGDVLGFAGSGNGLYYQTNDEEDDGQQSFEMFLGSEGQYEWNWNIDGSSSVPGPLTIDKTVDGGSATLFAYAGSPVGHVTPLAEGDICIDTTTPALWQATAAEDDTAWQEVGASGGGLGDLADQIFADSPTDLSADGAGHTVSVLVASPPSWMDDAGNITAPGLYALGITVTQDVAPATPDQFINVIYTSSFVQQSLAVDGFGAGPQGPFTVLALGAEDLPYSTEMGILMPTDADFTSAVQPVVWQLATAAGGGGGGGGVTLGTQETVTYTDPEFVNVNGTPVNQPSTTAGSPVSWMDDSGNIITAGLYQFGAILSNFQAATTPGLLLSVNVTGNNTFGENIQIYSYDDLATADYELTQYFVMALGEADLPFAASTLVNQLSATDDTAGFDLSSTVNLLASGAGGGGGGGGSFPDFTGTGSPEGVQTANVGQFYRDTTDLEGGLYMLGGGDDAVNYGWIALGAVPVDRTALTAGLMTMFGNTPAFMGDPTYYPQIWVATDTGAQANDGTQNGLEWFAQPDGEQSLSLTLGESGNFNWGWNADGSTGVPGPLTIDYSVDGGSATLFAYPGSPVGHVTPNQGGDLCLDADTPALWMATAGADDTAWEQLGAGGSGGGIGDIASAVLADTPTLLTADGTTTEIDPLIASPPSWMDDAGNITAPGLYALELQLSLGAAFATPGAFVFAQSVGASGASAALNTTAATSVDALGPAPQPTTSLVVVALGAGDVPFDAGFSVTMPTDGTGEINVQAGVWQLATGAGGGGGGGFDYEGDGSPEGVQTAVVGKFYADTTNGGLYVKVTGSGNTGWSQIGGASPGVPNTETGVGVFNDYTWVIGGSDGGLILTDPLAAVGSGNGIAIYTTGVDNEQQVNIQLQGTTFVFQGNGGSGLGSATFPNLQLGGRLFLESYFNANYIEETGGGPYAMAGTEGIVVCDDAITLPDPTLTTAGTIFWLKDSGAGTASVVPFGSETIDGVAGPVDLPAYGGLQLTVNDESNWLTLPAALGGGGGGSFPDFTGSGSPEGVVTANFGQWYRDTAGGDPATTGSAGLYFYAGHNGENVGWAVLGNNNNITSTAGLQFLTFDETGAVVVQLNDNGLPGGGIDIIVSGSGGFTLNNAGAGNIFMQSQSGFILDNQGGVTPDVQSQITDTGGGGLLISTEESGPINIDYDLTFADGSQQWGPVITDQSDGHTYRIISTAGVLSTQMVT